MNHSSQVYVAMLPNQFMSTVPVAEKNATRMQEWKLNLNLYKFEVRQDLKQKHF